MFTMLLLKGMGHVMQSVRKFFIILILLLLKINFLQKKKQMSYTTRLV